MYTTGLIPVYENRNSMSINGLPSFIEELADDRKEWVEALDNIYREYGEAGVRDILRASQNHVLNRGIALSEATLNTPYVNSIPLSEQPAYPGDIVLEKRIENIIRWNAMAMVLQRMGDQVSGGISRLMPRRRPYWKWVFNISSATDLIPTVATWSCLNPMQHLEFMPERL